MPGQQDERAREHPTLGIERHGDTLAPPTIFSTHTWEVPRSFGDYELLQEIARGGMGIVFRARQIQLGRLVALKMIASGQLASPEEVARFRREAEAAGTLDHPNIVPIYDVGEFEGQHFFTMKFVDGGSLDKLATADEKRLAGKPWQQQAARLVATAARAVHHAHQRGIIHRDIKPANILLQVNEDSTRSGGKTTGPCADDRSLQADFIPLISDFGLARSLKGHDRSSSTGGVVGTPSYMAPEQARSDKVLTTSVDVYSLGAVLYELLTGKPPFEAEVPLDTVLQVLEKEPVPPREINPSLDSDLETICLKCLEKDPARRYATALALAEDLDCWCAGGPIAARPISSLERGWRWCKRNPAIAGLAAGVLLTLLLGSTVSTYFAFKAEAVARHARHNELVAERSAYRAQMSQAWLFWQAGEAGLTDDLLDFQMPQFTQGRDLRGFEWHFLRRLAETGSRRLQAPNGPELGSPTLEVGQAVAFRPGTSQVAWVRLPAGPGRAPKVVLADLITGETTRTFANLSAVVFDRAGKFLAGRTVAAGTTTTSVSVWDVQSGTKIATLPGGKHCVFSPDGTSLVVVVSERASAKPGESGEIVVVWNWSTDKLSKPLAAGLASIHCLALSPDGKLLATGGVGPTNSNRGSRKSSVKLWELATGKELRSLSTGSVKALTFSPDGKHLATASYAGLARVWDAASGEQLLELGRESQQDRVSSLSYAANGTQLVTASDDHQIRIWDAVSGTRLRCFRGHNAPIVSVAVSTDSRTLASLARDGAARIWNATRDQEASSISIPNAASLSVAFEPNSKRLLVADTGGLQARDLESGLPAASSLIPERIPSQLGSILRSFLLSNDGQRLVALYWPEGRRGPVEVSIRDAGAKLARVVRMDRPTGNGVATAVSPDGRLLALGGAIQEIWDLDTEKPLTSLQGASTCLVNSLAFSADGKRLAVAESYFKGKAGDFASGIGRRVHVLNVDIGVQAAMLEDDSAAVDHLRFSLDGREVHGVGGRRLYCWDVGSGKKTQEFTLNAPANLPAFSPDCTRLVSASPEGKVILWDVATGQRLLTFAGFENQITDIEFDKAGVRLAIAGSAGANGIVRIYDATPLE